MRLPQKLRQSRDQENLGRRGFVLGEEKGVLALDQAGVEIGAVKGRAGDEARQEVDVVGDADDAIIGQRLQHARQRPVAVGVPGDQLGDHRIVVRA